MPPALFLLLNTARSAGGPAYPITDTLRAAQAEFFTVLRWYPPAPPRFGGMLRLRVARFLDIAILGNAVFLEYCVFLKRAIFEKALYDFMRDEG